MNDSLEWKENIVIQLLKKHLLKIVIFSIILSGLGAFAYTRMKAPSYTASGQMVENDNNYNLITSYKQFVTTRDFKKEMNAKLKQSNWKNFSNDNEYSLNISATTTSPFFTIDVTSNNANYSKYVANTAMSVLIANIGKYLSGAHISIVSSAKSSQKDSIKNATLAVGIIIFLVVTILSFVFVSFKDLFSGKVKDENYIQDVLGVKNLGTIDLMQSQRRAK